VLIGLFAAAVGAACDGVEDPDITVNAGGSAGQSGSGGTGGAGTGGTGGAGTGGTGGQGGSAGDAGNANTVCSEGDRSCGGPGNNTVRRCVADAWVEGETCSGSTPVCNGGTCAGLRLQGGFEAFGTRPSEGTTYVLKAQSLGLAPRVCNTDLCVTGGVR
jgi:hypothetical protein